MAIPSNLLPINNPFRQEVEEETSVLSLPSASTGVPTNLLRVNTSDISGSFQSLAGNVPTINAPEIPQFSILSVVIPDRLFTTGSLDQVKARTSNAMDRYYSSSLLAVPDIPTVDSVMVSPLPVPSYGQIKNYIKTKIDRIKQQRREASVKALDTDLKKQENPFKYRQSLTNQETKKTVLGRYNNL